jgi:hypothetical protein
MINSTINSPPREAFLPKGDREESPLAIVVVVRDPETEEERPLAIPFSLLVKLWPELTETMDRLEELIRSETLEI